MAVNVIRTTKKDKSSHIWTELELTCQFVSGNRHVTRSGIVPLERRERDSCGKNARNAADRARKLMDALQGEKRKAEVLKNGTTAQEKLSKQLRQEKERNDQIYI